MFYIKCGKEYHPWRGLLKKWIRHKTQEKKTGENLERDLVNSKKERSSEKFKTPRNCKENSGDEIFRILSEMSKQRKEIIDSMPQRAKLCMSQKEINQRLMSI